MKDKNNEIIKSDVGFSKSIKEFNDLAEQINEYTNTTNSIKGFIEDIFDNYLSIGSQLLFLDNNKLYKVGDYESILDLALNEFDLSNTTTKNIMLIVNKYCDDPTSLYPELKEEFKDFTFSALVELLPIDDIDFELYKPDLPVRKIRDRKFLENLENKFEKLFAEDSYLTKILMAIENYDYDSNFKIEGFELNYILKKDLNNNRFDFEFKLNNKKTKDKFSFNLEFYNSKLELKSNDIWFWQYIDNLDDVNKYLDGLIQSLFLRDKVNVLNDDQKEYITNASDVVEELYYPLGYMPVYNNVLNNIIKRLSTDYHSNFHYEIDNKTLNIYLYEVKSETNNPLISFIYKDSIYLEKIIFSDKNLEKDFKNFLVQYNSLMDEVKQLLSFVPKDEENE